MQNGSNSNSSPLSTASASSKKKQSLYGLFLKQNPFTKKKNDAMPTSVASLKNLGANITGRETVAIHMRWLRGILSLVALASVVCGLLSTVAYASSVRTHDPETAAARLVQQELIQALNVLLCLGGILAVLRLYTIKAMRVGYSDPLYEGRSSIVHSPYLVQMIVELCFWCAFTPPFLEAYVATASPHDTNSTQSIAMATTTTTSPPSIDNGAQTTAALTIITSVAPLRVRFSGAAATVAATQTTGATEDDAVGVVHVFSDSPSVWIFRALDFVAYFRLYNLALYLKEVVLTQRIFVSILSVLGHIPITTSYFIRTEMVYEKMRTSLVAVGIVWMSLGFAFYQAEEGIGLFDSFYFVFTTAGMVGYGDIVPNTIVGKLIAFFSWCFGLLIFGWVVTLFQKSLNLTEAESNLYLMNRANKTSRALQGEAALAIQLAWRFYRVNRLKRLINGQPAPIGTVLQTAAQQPAVNADGTSNIHITEILTNQFQHQQIDITTTAASGQSALASDSSNNGVGVGSGGGGANRRTSLSPSFQQVILSREEAQQMGGGAGDANNSSGGGSAFGGGSSHHQSSTPTTAAPVIGTSANSREQIVLSYAAWRLRQQCAKFHRLRVAFRDDVAIIEHRMLEHEQRYWMLMQAGHHTAYHPHPQHAHPHAHHLHRPPSRGGTPLLNPLLAGLDVAGVNNAVSTVLSQTHPRLANTMLMGIGGGVGVGGFGANSNAIGSALQSASNNTPLYAGTVSPPPQPYPQQQLSVPMGGVAGGTVAIPRLVLPTTADAALALPATIVATTHTAQQAPTRKRTLSDISLPGTPDRSAGANNVNQSQQQQQHTLSVAGLNGLLSKSKSSTGSIELDRENTANQIEMPRSPRGRTPLAHNPANPNATSPFTSQQQYHPLAGFHNISMEDVLQIATTTAAVSAAAIAQQQQQQQAAAGNLMLHSPHNGPLGGGVGSGLHFGPGGLVGGSQHALTSPVSPNSGNMLSGGGAGAAGGGGGGDSIAMRKVQQEMKKFTTILTQVAEQQSVLLMTIQELKADVKKVQEDQERMRRNPMRHLFLEGNQQQLQQLQYQQLNAATNNSMLSSPPSAASSGMGPRRVSSSSLAQPQHHGGGGGGGGGGLTTAGSSGNNSFIMASHPYPPLGPAGGGVGGLLSQRPGTLLDNGSFYAPPPPCGALASTLMGEHEEVPPVLRSSSYNANASLNMNAAGPASMNTPYQQQQRPGSSGGGGYSCAGSSPRTNHLGPTSTAGAAQPSSFTVTATSNNATFVMGGGGGGAVVLQPQQQYHPSDANPQNREGGDARHNADAPVPLLLRPASKGSQPTTPTKDDYNNGNPNTFPLPPLVALGSSALERSAQATAGGVPVIEVRNSRGDVMAPQGSSTFLLKPPSNGGGENANTEGAGQPEGWALTSHSM